MTLLLQEVHNFQQLQLYSYTKTMVKQSQLQVLREPLQEELIIAELQR